MSCVHRNLLGKVGVIISSAALVGSLALTYLLGLLSTLPATGHSTVPLHP